MSKSEIEAEIEKFKEDELKFSAWTNRLPEKSGFFWTRTHGGKGVVCYFDHQSNTASTCNGVVSEMTSDYISTQDVEFILSEILPENSMKIKSEIELTEANADLQDLENLEFPSTKNAERIVDLKNAIAEFESEIIESIGDLMDEFMSIDDDLDEPLGPPAECSGDACESCQ